MVLIVLAILDFIKAVLMLVLHAQLVQLMTVYNVLQHQLVQLDSPSTVTQINVNQLLLHVAIIHIGMEHLAFVYLTSVLLMVSAKDALKD